MLIRIYFLLTLLSLCMSSEVLDEYSQKAIIKSDYCPTIRGCQDGTHVMCLYYDPKRVLGPACADAFSLEITPDLAKLIVDITNRIRSKIANGLESNGEDMGLPRAYGMFKLTWDPELATLAQLWANQCIMRMDFCRSTKRFPTAGQIVGKIKFSIDGWMPVSDNESFDNTTVPTPEKIKYAITFILRAWYETRNDIDCDIINYFDTKAYSKNNQFVQLVSGPNTHMGCGISAYREYTFNRNDAPLNYNSILLVCNFSYQPRLEDPVYMTKPPSEPGYTVKCGCPLGFDEDEDCLCYETDRQMPYTCKESGKCKPSVVVLPIFTVEDAPLNALGNKSYIDLTKRAGSPNTIVMKSGSFKDYTRSNRNYKHSLIKQDSLKKTRRTSTVDVKKRHFGAKSKTTSKQTIPNGGNRKHIPRQSIFTKVAIFELSSNKQNHIAHHANEYKKDVVPRRDFTKVQKLMSKYLENRRMGNSLHKNQENHNLTHIMAATIGPISSTVGNMQNYLNKFSKQKFTYIDFNSTKSPTPKNVNIKPTNQDTDQILMNLLDKLEEEVNNINFNMKEKEKFDEKIRKIYGTLVKKPILVEQEKFVGVKNVSVNNEIVGNEMLKNNYNRKHFWLDPDKPNEYTYPYLEERPINENSLKKHNGNINEHLMNNKYKDLHKLSYRNKPLYENMDDRELGNIYTRQKSHFNSLSNGRSIIHDNYDLKSDLDDYNSLEPDRRRNYYEKLNKLQHKMSLMKKHERIHYVTEDRHLRPVRGSKHGNLRRSKPKEMDVYMPNRARFLHGF